MVHRFVIGLGLLSVHTVLLARSKSAFGCAAVRPDSKWHAATKSRWVRSLTDWDALTELLRSLSGTGTSTSAELVGCMPMYADH